MIGTSTDKSSQSWRAVVLQQFSEDIAASCRVTVVGDPDGLLLDDDIAARLSDAGFELVRYGDPIEFRFIYESRHRSKWDQGEHTSIVVSAPWSRVFVEKK